MVAFVVMLILPRVPGIVTEKGVCVRDQIRGWSNASQETSKCAFVYVYALAVDKALHARLTLR